MTRILKCRTANPICAANPKPSSRFLRLARVFAVVFLGALVYSSPSQAEDMAGSPAAERYVDHGDNTVSDTKTGLMWIRQDSYLHKKKWMNWFESQDYIEKLNAENYAGHSDWRIPELEELRSLYEKDKFNSAQVGREMKIHIDPVFAKEGAGSLWSSRDNGRFNAYGVIFNNGRSFSQSKKSRNRKAVRAVRHDLP